VSVVVAGLKRLLRLTVAAAALTAAIAACSSGNDSSGSAAPSVATTTSAAAPTTSAPAGGEATSSDGGGSGGSDDGQAAGSGTITIKDFAFGAPLTVRPGATIKVTNQDAAAHDVSSDDEGRFRTPLLNKDESATFTAPTQPGTYKFSCTVHGQMQGIGTLIVHD
jgi:plastocyanin